MRWTLDAYEEVSSLAKSDPGNVDLLNTTPLPDSAANAGTPMPTNIADHEGGVREQIVCKFDIVKYEELLVLNLNVS